MNTTPNPITSTRNGSVRHRVIPALAGIVFGLAPLSAASAQHVIDLDQDQGQTQTHTTCVFTTDDCTVRVESDGNAAKISLNGNLVTTLDLNDAWTRYEVKDENEKTVATVLRAAGSTNLMIVRGSSNGTVVDWPFGGSGAGGWVTGGAEGAHALEEAKVFARSGGFAVDKQPRVMIGITATGLEEGELEGLDVDPDSVTVISTVVKDGPAARAGLIPGDVILRINGEDPGNLKAIREVLSEKEPGDQVGMVALRNGEQHRYTLTLDEFKPERFWPDAFSEDWTFDIGGVADLAELQGKIEKRSTELNELGAKLGSATRSDSVKIREQMDKLTKEISELAQMMASQRFRRQLGSDIQVQILGDEEGGKRGIVLMPTPPAPPDAQSTAALQQQLDHLSQRLDNELAKSRERMDKMEEEIDRKLDELVDELIRRMRERTE